MKTSSRNSAAHGFVLVVTLSLMVLLAILATGMLSISAITLRASSQEGPLVQARANARMALALAIGELQRTAGSDTRITAPANLLNPQAPAGVAGVWRSWRTPMQDPDYAAAKTGDNFLGYLMSNPNPEAQLGPNELPSGTMVQLVGPGSVGDAKQNAEVYAPLVELPNGGQSQKGGISWVVLDEGVKSRIDLEPALPAVGQGERLTQIGAPERNGFHGVNDMEFLLASNAAQRDDLREVLPKLVSLNEANLAAGKVDALHPYFHDFNIGSESLQVDVVNGGLKTDLSVMFDSATLPADYGTRYLYSDTSSALNGGPDPRWSLYQNYARLYLKNSPSDNAKDGFQAGAGDRYRLKAVRSATSARGQRYEPNMATVVEPVLMPTVARVDVVFSLVVRDAHANWAAGLRSKGYPYMLHMMYLPVVTLHNPFNTPLRFRELEIEFSDLPLGFEFFINDRSATNGMKAFNQLYVGRDHGNDKKTFRLNLTGDITSVKEVVMGPGETRIFGKPFPPNWTWAQEMVAEDAGGAGARMFDWRNDRTASGAAIMPGMITGPTDGIGYDIDWIAPGTKPEWLKVITNDGILPVRAMDKVSVSYGPMKQNSSPNNDFSFTVRAKHQGRTTDIATTQVFYRDEMRLKAVLEEGVSQRFPHSRNFPETYPRTGEAPRTASQLYEANSRQIRAYGNARPFAVFSMSAKTTKESFTPSRPVADTGAVFQMANCDFTANASQGSNPYEFMLVPVASGAAAIESDGDLGYFFGGHGTMNGTTSAVYYELPMAPLQSIAQLRHANGASLGTMPYVTYSVGESRAHPALPPNQVVYTAGPSMIRYDHSWLANDRLWDSYWFSTLASLQGVAYSGNSAMTLQEHANRFFEGSRSLPNARNIVSLSSGKLPEEAAAAAIDPSGKSSAAYITTAGGFNVNSTSVAAWASVLSGLCEADVPIYPDTMESVGQDVPFPRTRQAVLSRDNGILKEQLWSGYRTLKPEQIQVLAEKIVEEVHRRGPFLSMSEFVNRRIGLGNDELTGKGALQAAIDHAGLNTDILANANTIEPSDVSGFGWINESAVTGNTGAGAPGEISQGDILSAIGSFITVRSDTFKIRAYGDAKNVNGKVLARAWCEAVVQRTPLYLDPADAPEALANSEVNKTFGRQFRVVSFRWLKPEEI